MTDSTKQYALLTSLGGYEIPALTLASDLQTVEQVNAQLKKLTMQEQLVMHQTLAQVDALCKLAGIDRESDFYYDSWQAAVLLAVIQSGAYQKG